MNIDEMKLHKVNSELKRAIFWVKDSPIKKSLELINKMEKQRIKLIKNKVS